MSNSSNRKNKVFDYRALRLLMGIIALALPFVVSILSSSPLSSISASYYTEARDMFVGMLFIVGSFLWAYNGNSKTEAIASDVASIAAIGVAIFPTACKDCPGSPTATLHYLAAALLFVILAYFCFIPFRQDIKGKRGKKGLRSKIYLLCGTTMILCMAAMVIANAVLPGDVVESAKIIYWGEAIALGAFGIAWIVSGKASRLIAEEDEVLHLF
ncbi:hypothetical protein [Lyngbya confervoides]|uniref:DUF998 domain-containing protein n=1 Tax=Lyngbya confervoides BDU141951 TaxID=1574623 RepID=A0ABD4T0I9_9CYAN|nr:hypothetical protein [Lyngbya confervoides]MCM1982039.1 hypothetical protein [Lyngbya confervoides BDU141951]